MWGKKSLKKRSSGVKNMSNDYGMPLEEVMRRLHAFIDSPQHEEFLNNLCNDLIDRMTKKRIILKSDKKWRGYKNG